MWQNHRWLLAARLDRRRTPSQGDSVMDFSNIAIALCKLFSLLIVGYFLNKKKILDSHINTGLSALLLNATNPALILSSLGATGSVAKGDVSKLLVFGLCFYIMLPLFAWIVVHLLRIHPSKRSIAQLLIIFSNTGFMAIPILQTLYGDVSVFYSNILNLPFNFLFFSYGVYLINRENANRSAERLDWRKFINPGIFASAVALLLYFCNIQLPNVATETFSFLGNITPPLSMIILGSVLAEYPLSSIFKDLKINLMLLIKQLLLPVVATVLAHMVFTDPIITGIITLTFAMPCATMTVMLSKEYKSDTLTASAGVVFTTVLSLITIPIAFVLFVL